MTPLTSLEFILSKYPGTAASQAAFLGYLASLKPAAPVSYIGAFPGLDATPTEAQLWVRCEQRVREGEDLCQVFLADDNRVLVEALVAHFGSEKVYTTLIQALYGREEQRHDLILGENEEHLSMLASLCSQFPGDSAARLAAYVNDWVGRG